MSGLLCSLRTEDLNAKLRAVGQKPFHLRTIQALQLRPTEITNYHKFFRVPNAVPLRLPAELKAG